MYQIMDLGRCDDLTDDELIRRFESLTLPADQFGHADHVRLAFAYLRRHGLLDTLRLYRDGLKRFAAHHGDGSRYHETVTWALVILIHERMILAAEPADWTSFAETNPDLLRWRDGAFFEYYRPEVLESDVARRAFVLPR